MKYPPTKREDLVETLHGTAVSDPYRWLEDINTEQTENWVAAQNVLSADYLQSIALREPIYDRLKALWDYEKCGVPFKRNQRYFHSRNDGLQNQSVLYWQESLQDEVKVLLDPNQWSEDGTIALSGYSVSEDARLIAYGISESGSDWQQWRVRDIDSGAELEDCVRWVKFSGASWSHDHQGFFYSRYDQPDSDATYKSANEYHKLFYHRLGTSQDEGRLIYKRDDHKEWNFGGRVSHDGRYLIIYVSKGTHRENAVFYKDLQHGLDSEVVELLNGFDASYHFIGNDDRRFYFVTDADAPLSRLIAIDIDQPQRDHWQEIIAESTDVLQSVSVIDQRFVAFYLHHAHDHIRVFDKSGCYINDVTLPGLGSIAGFSGRHDESEVFYAFTSFTVPTTVYRYDMDSGHSALFYQPQVDFNADDYITEQVFYPSKDGTRIPMFLSYKKNLRRDGDNPVFLYGYGGFNISLTPAFSVSNLVWMEQGGIYAQANLRGGDEYGRAWHEAGARHNKQNVFDDFIAAAEWLIENKYTRTSRLAIGGGSNGGLLVAACLTQRPDLFGACYATVGVLDMLRFHLFTIGRAWTSDYGSPDDAEDFKVLLNYSPYHNIKAGVAYPATLITTGDHDDRVFPAHSYKFAAALQAAQSAEAPVLIRIETRAGHGAGKPTSKLLEELADRWAFLLKNLGT